LTIPRAAAPWLPSCGHASTLLHGRSPATATTRLPRSVTPATRRSTASSCPREARSPPHARAGDGEADSGRTVVTANGPDLRAFRIYRLGILRGSASYPASCRPAPKPRRRGGRSPLVTRDPALGTTWVGMSIRLPRCPHPQPASLRR